MRLIFFQRLNWLFGLVPIGIVVGLSAVIATIEIKDLDLWLHLRMGEWIVQHGTVPLVDVLSASFANKPWINHEWLFQVVVYLVKDSWGMDGLLYMQAGLVMLTLSVMLLLVYDRDRQLLIAPLLYLVLQVYQTRFTVRPDLFSMFFFVTYVFILSTRLSQPSSVWILFILQVIWSNMHGYSLWGIVFIVIALGSEFIKRRVALPFEWNGIGRLTDEEYRRLGFIFLAAVAAMFITPLGWEGVLYPLRTLAGLSAHSRIFFENITELAPPLTWQGLLDIGSDMPFKALILLSFVSFIFNRRRMDISAFFLWLVFLVFSLSAVRNISYFALAAFLVTMHNCAELKFADIFPFRPSDQRLFQLTGVALAILMTVQLLDYADGVSGRGYYDFDKYERKSEFLGVSQRSFARKGVDFLIRNRIAGNFFNDFNSGAYLIGRAYPQVRVYIDGRTEMRGPEFFANYKKIWSEGNEGLFDKAVADYGLTGVFVNTSAFSAPARFLRMIAGKKEWVPVYLDYDAVILLKDIPKNFFLTSRFRLDLAAWKVRELDLKELGPARVVPYWHLRRAQSLFDMGYDGPALMELEAALKVIPAYDEAFRLMGDIYQKRAEPEKAFAYYRLACAYEPGATCRKGLAQAYLDLGLPGKSVEQAEKACDADPNDATARFLLGKALVKNKQYQKGYDILNGIPQDKRKSEGITDKIGVLLNEVRDMQRGKKDP